MYVGLVVFIIGLLALIAYLIENSRSASNSSAAILSELLQYRQPATVNAPHSLPRRRKNPVKPIAGDGFLRHTALEGYSIPRVNRSSGVTGLYRNNQSEKGAVQLSGNHCLDTERRIPKDLILTRTRQGADELEIAHGLGIGRDAVAMVLNLYSHSVKE